MNVSEFILSQWKLHRLGKPMEPSDVPLSDEIVLLKRFETASATPAVWRVSIGNVTGAAWTLDSHLQLAIATGDGLSMTLRVPDGKGDDAE